MDTYITDKPLVAWRVWSVSEDGHLFSINGTPWYPCIKLTAECRCHPAEHHTCGIYCTKTRNYLMTLSYPAMSLCAYGEVWAWGTMIEHTDGYRAEHAYPKNLILAHEPYKLVDCQARIEGLQQYKVDLFFQGNNIDIPLWSPDEGYVPEGLDIFLTEKSKTKPVRCPALAMGDRVFVGADIGIVKMLGPTGVILEVSKKYKMFGEPANVKWDRKRSIWTANNRLFTRRSL